MYNKKIVYHAVHYSKELFKITISYCIALTGLGVTMKIYTILIIFVINHKMTSCKTFSIFKTCAIIVAFIEIELN